MLLPAQESSDWFTTGPRGTWIGPSLRPQSPLLLPGDYPSVAPIPASLPPGLVLQRGVLTAGTPLGISLWPWLAYLFLGLLLGFLIHPVQLIQVIHKHGPYLLNQLSDLGECVSSCPTGCDSCSRLCLGHLLGGGQCRPGPDLLGEYDINVGDHSGSGL